MLLWLCFALQAACVYAGEPLQEAADQVRRDFAELVEPPIEQRGFATITAMESGAPMRAYVLRAHGQAIDALLALATTPERSARVAKMLRRIGIEGSSMDADEWFAELGRSDAASARHAVAIRSLSRALRELMSPPDRGIRFGQSFSPELAAVEAAYRQSAGLEPADPWTWLTLAWLTGLRGEPDVERALGAARKAGNVLVQLLAQQQLARIRQAQGRGSEARDIWIAVAQQASAATNVPASWIGPRERAQELNALAIHLADTGANDAAMQTFERVLDIRWGLVQAKIGALPSELEWIATLQRLGKLRREAGLVPLGSTQQKDLELRAWIVYQALEHDARFKPTIPRRSWSGVGVAALLQAGVLTLLGALLLLALYRWRIGRLMMAASSATGVAGAVAPQIGAPAAPRADAVGETRPPLVQRAGRALGYAAVVQVAAGLAFGLCSAALQLYASEFDSNLSRWLVLTWSAAWPTLLVLGMLWAGDRRLQAWALCVYLGGLALICVRLAWVGTPPVVVGNVMVPGFFQGLVYWAVAISWSPFLLLFLNRKVRAVGPPLLLMALVACAGSVLLQFAASTPVARKPLAQLLGWLPLFEWLFIPAIALAGMLLFAPFAWAAAALLRAAHQAKWINDQTMVADSIWLAQSIVLAQSLVMSSGPAGWVGLGLFFVYKAISVLAMLPLAPVAHAREPSRLLLLRVFRQRRRSERLFDLLGARWRFAGPIRMIGAPDLAGSTIDPDEILDFLAGRLRQRFILHPGDLQARIDAIDDRCDIDGRFRVTDVFCGNDTWQTAVRALMARSDLVAMDLRGFSAQNHGCLYELQALLDSVPCRRVALLVDAKTDQTLLRGTLEGCLARLGADSPNLRAGRGSISLLDAGAGELAAVRQLLRLAEAHSQTQSQTQSRP